MAPQLQINQGPQDALLYDNNRSYFYNVGYVRTSNFQVEYQEVQPQNNPANPFGTTVSYIIPKSADLLGAVDLEVEIPALEANASDVALSMGTYQGSDDMATLKDTSTSTGVALKVPKTASNGMPGLDTVSQQTSQTFASERNYMQWVDELGFACIEKITFSIGSNDIETLTGEQLQIKNELMTSDEMRLGYDQVLKTGRPICEDVACPPNVPQSVSPGDLPPYDKGNMQMRPYQKDVTRVIGYQGGLLGKYGDGSYDLPARGFLTSSTAPGVLYMLYGFTNKLSSGTGSADANTIEDPRNNSKHEMASTAANPVGIPQEGDIVEGLGVVVMGEMEFVGAQANQTAEHGAASGREGYSRILPFSLMGDPHDVTALVEVVGKTTTLPSDASAAYDAHSTYASGSGSESPTIRCIGIKLYDDKLHLLRYRTTHAATDIVPKGRYLHHAALPTMKTHPETSDAEKGTSLGRYRIKPQEADYASRSGGTTVLCKARKLTIPLRFFFTYHVSQYFPLAAIAGCNDIRIQVKFRALKDLVQTYASNARLRFLTPFESGVSTKLITHTVHVTGPEAQLLMNKEHVRLLKLYQHQPDLLTSTTQVKPNHKMNLTFLHPVSTLIITIRRARDVNSDMDGGLDSSSKGHFFYHGDGANPNYDMTYDPSATEKNQTIKLKSIQLKLNGQDRHSALDKGIATDYLQHRLLPLLHSNSNSTNKNMLARETKDTGYAQQFYASQGSKNIYVYPFSLNPEGGNPSGAVNFSKVSHSELTLHFDETFGFPGRHGFTDWQVDVYALYYNWLQIKDGRALLSFA